METDSAKSWLKLFDSNNDRNEMMKLVKDECSENGYD